MGRTTDRRRRRPWHMWPLRRASKAKLTTRIILFGYVSANIVLVAGMCRWTMCPPSSVCRLRRSGRARCVCRPCDDAELDTGPVCGFDGRTYTSACKLHRANCRARQHTDVDYAGPCQSL